MTIMNLGFECPASLDRVMRVECLVLIYMLRYHELLNHLDANDVSRLSTPTAARLTPCSV